MKETTYLGIAFFIALFAMGTLVFIGISNGHQRSVMAKEAGCEYLGTARDLIGVAFYECNGEIIMKRTKDKL
jgi:hypothetical protein